MDDLKNTIASLPIYKGLSKPDLDSLARIASMREYRKGAIIFFEGEYCDGFYVVAKGRVKITKISSKGKEQILYILETGEPFGQLAIYHGDAFPATAQALETSVCLFFPKTPFLELISQRPALPMNMLAFLARRHRELTLQIENIALKEVPERLAEYLLYLCWEQKSLKTVSLPISKEQLAYLLGATPETLSRSLAKLVDDGMIMMDGKDISIIDEESLNDLARSMAM
ncbi:transcriptional regulator, Crp/Fnr family [Desulfatibacillum aliphaticivorans]|uniref:Transcriptional regulator, Crp/Fnr family n=1 Tax=Desulfatibacillum aliphaticivorans TaxID=218208 RepID=B8FC47_DESAL|nr:Crp/Fnr family transcriptional regulator [Desulfatibacillum aliphaticivorans]ACL05252.1 transcriptional regulator, Crp/Fnr family [Desulfatibacillum aliphaticivorans]